MNAPLHSLRQILLSVIVSALTLPALAAPSSQTKGQSPESGIVRALLRDWAVPWRDGYKENPPRPINVFSDSLTPCPKPPEVVRGCITSDVLPRAHQEAAKGLWSFDLVRELEQQSKDAVVFRDLDVSGFARVVVGPKADLLQAVGFPLQISRPAVRGKNALVVVQFARLSTWLVLLTEKDDGWSVTTKIAWGMS
jgi:hypothetical protein